MTKSLMHHLTSNRCPSPQWTPRGCVLHLRVPFSLGARPSLVRLGTHSREVVCPNRALTIALCWLVQMQEDIDLDEQYRQSLSEISPNNESGRLVCFCIVPLTVPHRSRVHSGISISVRLRDQGWLPEISGFEAVEVLSEPLVQGSEPWVNRVRGVDLRLDFQSLVNALFHFHLQFRKPKYAQGPCSQSDRSNFDVSMNGDAVAVWSVLRYPLSAFLTAINSVVPPNETFVASFAGSMSAQMQCLLQKKSGKDKNRAFLAHGACGAPSLLVVRWMCKVVAMRLMSACCVADECLFIHSQRGAGVAGDVRAQPAARPAPAQGRREARHRALALGQIVG